MTASGMRTYFVWTGVLGILFTGVRLAINLIAISRWGVSSDILATTVINFGFLCFACLFLYNGLNLYRFLKSFPRRVSILLYAFGGWLIIALMLNMRSGLKPLNVIVSAFVLYALWIMARDVRRINVLPDAIAPSSSVHGFAIPIPVRSTQNFLWSLLFFLYGSVGIAVEYSIATGQTAGTFDPFKLGLSVLILIAVIVVWILWVRQLQRTH